MKQNIGTLDRYIRLSAGLMIYGSGLSRRRTSLGKYALLSLGAMKMAEGITGWCPLLAIAGVSTLDEQSQTSPQSKSHDGTSMRQRSDDQTSHTAVMDASHTGEESHRQRSGHNDIPHDNHRHSRSENTHRDSHLEQRDHDHETNDGAHASSHHDTVHHSTH